MAATLTVVLPSEVSSVSIGGRQYGGPFSYSAAVKFTSISISGSWSGTVYWGSSSGSTSYKIATVTSGKVVMATQEPIDYLGYDRTIYVTAVSATTRYYYQIHAFANNGTFSDGTTSYYTPVSSTGTSTSGTFDVGLLKEPTRSGYTFLGWGYTSNATTYYKDTEIAVSTTATDSRDPKIINLYAIWENSTYAYVKCGQNVKAISVYIDGSLKLYITSSGWHYVSTYPTSTVKLVVTAEDGYGSPFYIAFLDSETSTSSSYILKFTSGEYSYTYSDRRKYASVSASQAVTPFYWYTSDTTDNQKIATGKPTKNLTASSWNKMKAKIRLLAAALNVTVNVGSDVAASSAITAREFNTVRAAIRKLSSTALLPAEVNSGDVIKASYFNGGGSLKSGLNYAISQYNSE